MTELLSLLGRVDAAARRIHERLESSAPDKPVEQAMQDAENYAEACRHLTYLAGVLEHMEKRPHE